MTQSSKLMTNKNIFSDKWRHPFDFASFDLFSTAQTTQTHIHTHSSLYRCDARFLGGCKVLICGVCMGGSCQQLEQNEQCFARNIQCELWYVVRRGRVLRKKIPFMSNLMQSNAFRSQ